MKHCDCMYMYRDAFIFHPSATPPFPSVFRVRSHSILISLHCVRMIVCKEACYIMSLPKMNEPWSIEAYVSTLEHPFLTQLMDALRRDRSIDFPLLVLDTALHAVVHAYEAELFEVEHDSHRYASHLARTHTHHEYIGFVEKVHEIKVQLSKLTASVNETKEALDAVVQESQLPAAWCYGESNIQFEEILQSVYIKSTVAILRLQLIKEYIESREMMARLVLDAKRNQLFSIDLMISTLSMGFGYAGMVAGIWGMNLYNTVYEDSKSVFVYVMASLLMGAIGLPMWIRFYMKSRHLTYLPSDTSTL